MVMNLFKHLQIRLHSKQLQHQPKNTDMGVVLKRHHFEATSTLSCGLKVVYMSSGCVALLKKTTYTLEI